MDSMLIIFADWLANSGFKKNENGKWSPLDLPFLYTTEELILEFNKDIEYGKVRINE